MSTTSLSSLVGFAHRFGAAVALSFATACGPIDGPIDDEGALDLEEAASDEEALTGRDLARVRKVVNPNEQFTGEWVGGTQRTRFTSISPDGRIIIDNAGEQWFLTPTQAPNSGELSASGLMNVHFLDNLIVKDAGGKPVSVEVTTSDGSAPVAGEGGISNQMAFTADPRLGGGFPVRIGGNSDAARLSACSVADPSGIVSTPSSAYECRRMLLVEPIGKKLHSAEIAIVTKTFDEANPNARRRVLEIVDARFVRKFQLIGDGVVGIEPTATADSRLLVFATGRPLFVFSETPWDPASFSAPKSLFLLNKTVAEGGIADQEVCLATRDGTGRCRGSLVRFKERYPLAAYPFLNADGSAYTGMGGQGRDFSGTYPWIAFDGTELFFGLGNQNGGRSIRTLLGQGTKGTFKYVDHQVNAARGRYCVSPFVRSLGPTDTGCVEGDGTRTAQPLGTSTGLWRAFPEQEEALLPLNRRTPMHVLVDHNNLLGPFGATNFNTRGENERRIYVEVPMDDFSDGNFVAYFHMNELLKVNNDRIDAFDVSRTPDTSGNFYTAALSGSALFPFEHDGNQDLPGKVNPGFLGRAIYLRRDGGVVVSRAAARARPTGGGVEGPLGSSFDQLTVELAAKLLVGPTQFTALRLAEAPSSWKLELVKEAGNVVVLATIHKSDTETVTLKSDAIAQSIFHHVALTVERPTGPAGGSTVARLYLNGVQVRTLSFRANVPVRAVPAGQANLLVLGPNGSDRSAVGGTDLLLLDEVAVSKVVRSPEYIAKAAFQRFATPGFTPGRAERELPKLLSITGTLPLGLNAGELRVPNVVLDLFTAGTDDQKRLKFARIRALGESLFHDDLLTTHKSGTTLVRNAGRSCATCHAAAEGFAHAGVAFDKKVGSTTATLAVNTPTALNRAFATAQFFDARSPHIVDLVTKPLENPDEMGGKIVDVLTAINSQGARPPAGVTRPRGVTTYKQWFTFAFGAAVTTVAKAQLEQALAIYTLSLLSGSSNVDQVLAGESTGDTALDQQLKRGAQLFFGKARCVACHSGSNFSDETLHASGPSGLPTKTPTLRDVALTAPYFRDGSRATLSAVVDFYNDGGCRKSETLGGTTITGLACDPELFPLGLTASEKADLVTFLENLNGQ